MKTYNSIKDLQKNPEIKEILKEKQKADQDYFKHKKKKAFIIIISIIIFVVLFQIFIKEIHIKSPFPFDHGYGFEVKVNDKPAHLTVIETKEATILPFFIKIDSVSENILGLNGEHYIELEKNKDYEVTVSAHECYATNMKNRLTKCTEPYANYELKAVPTKDWRLKISNGLETIYDESELKINVDKVNRYYCTLYTKIEGIKVEVSFNISVK